ncbi:long-chain fatty acid--CoA ligase [Paenactinomyces guangxiensis]|uniref:Long-chain fatty acid--CoA ligase n=1 Tax=Paenactinomyces guangxiensis TaxID=1490290 RepID=A0A7W1WSI2_9BACL|nr:long-chain fatty acid--CoA ligase [Paenactinomyces guangxiensis]MBA4495217.1 long-chain fatty acid--CoA ligase [Paenactinomyces guangxiensis]MBH8592301.1 long-chain fatty acid--CoA ligase [Paenactinomyces guangxiensis]
MSWVVDWLESRARLTPDRIAIVDAQTGKRWSYGQLNHRAIRLASALDAQGVRFGDRVAILSPNHVAYFDLLFACAKTGAIFVPLNWRLSLPELKEIVLDCTPKSILYHSQFKKEVKCLPISFRSSLDELELEYTQTQPKTVQIPVKQKMTDPWMILYTGGTTGKPKGVVITHKAAFWNAMNTQLSWGLTAEDTTPVYLPMFHSGGLNALSLPLLYIGGTIVIGGKFEVEKAIDVIEKERCTIALMVPTMYHLMVQSSHFTASRFPAMRVFLSGGAPCPLSVYQAFAQKGIPFKEGYGLTEAGPNNFQIDPETAATKRGSVGVPMFFNQIQLVSEGQIVNQTGEVGEIWIRGGHLFAYYWNNPEATGDAWVDGWFRTGDLGKRDLDGYYYIVGRKKDMIVTGGENVYPLEVEQVLGDHPDVSEVSVVGLPDDHWGEVVAAVVVACAGKTLTPAQLQAYCATRLGRYKVPKKIYLADELPKTPVGKIDKKGIVQKYG